MAKETNRIIYFLALFLVASFTSCDSKRVYDSYVSIPGKYWQVNNDIIFSFAIKDTITANNLFINIRNNKEYSFSNLFIITQLKFPDGKKIIDTLEYKMTDLLGRFLGKGFTDIKENKLFYKENIIFPMAGDYSVTLTQAMRKNDEAYGIKSLEGIIDVGFRIENRAKTNK